MKKLLFFAAALTSMLGFAQTDTVIFQVDMNNYCGAPFTTVYVNGTFNGWAGTTNPMSDADSDGVWDVAIPLSPDTIEYKFTLDGWSGQENFTPGMSCTVTNGGFTNRSLIINGNATLPVVCWNSCSACVTNPLSQIDLPINWEGSTVDYSVSDFGGDSSAVVVDPTNSSNMVLMSTKTATAETWAGTTLSTECGFASIIPVSSGNTTFTVDVWSPDSGIAVRLKIEDHLDPTKSVETEAMTTASNAWQTLTFDMSNQATGTAPVNFTYNYDKMSIFYNFGVNGATAGSKTYYCDNVQFGSGGGSTSYNITFQVDMNNYSGTFTTPELNGDFNGWCGNCTPMSDANGDNIWDVTVMLADSVEFKYSFDNWAGQESLMQGMPCTKTTSGFTNRFMHITQDTTLPAVCWESCVTCGGTPTTSNVTFQLDMTKFTGTFTTPELNGTFNGWCGNCNAMSDADGDNIWDVTVTIPTGDTIDYKYSYDNWAGQETLMQGMPCTMTTTDSTGTFTNRYYVPMGDTTLPAVCWESCTDCNAVSINENEINDLIVSPNPSTGMVMIQGSFDKMTDFTISAYDLQGRLINSMTSQGINLNETIDLSTAKDGVYMISIITEEGISQKKLIVQH